MTRSIIIKVVIEFEKYEKICLNMGTEGEEQASCQSWKWLWPPKLLMAIVTGLENSWFVQCYLEKQKWMLQEWGKRNLEQFILDLCLHVTCKFVLKSTPSIWLHQRSSELLCRLSWNWVMQTFVKVCCLKQYKNRAHHMKQEKYLEQKLQRETKYIFYAQYIFL